MPNATLRWVCFALPATLFLFVSAPIPPAAAQLPDRLGSAPGPLDPNNDLAPARKVLAASQEEAVAIPAAEYLNAFTKVMKQPAEADLAAQLMWRLIRAHPDEPRA